MNYNHLKDITCSGDWSFCDTVFTVDLFHYGDDVKDSWLFTPVAVGVLFFSL